MWRVSRGVGGGLVEGRSSGRGVGRVVEGREGGCLKGREAGGLLAAGQGVLAVGSVGSLPAEHLMQRSKLGLPQAGGLRGGFGGRGETLAPLQAVGGLGRQGGRLSSMSERAGTLADCGWPCILSLPLLGLALRLDMGGLPGRPGGPTPLLAWGVGWRWRGRGRKPNPPPVLSAVGGLRGGRVGGRRSERGRIEGHSFGRRAAGVSGRDRGSEGPHHHWRRSTG